MMDALGTVLVHAEDGTVAHDGLARIQGEVLRFGRYLISFFGAPAFLLNTLPVFLAGHATLFLWLESAAFLFAVVASWTFREREPSFQALVLGIPVLLVSVFSLGHWGLAFGSGVLQMAVLTLLLIFFYASLRSFLLISFLVLGADAVMALAVLQGWIPPPQMGFLDPQVAGNWIRVLLSAAAAVPITAFILSRMIQRLTEALRQSEAQLAELRREQAAREEAQRALSRVQRMEVVGRLASGLSHDFNNTLTLIRGTAELLQMDLTREEDREMTEDILRAVDSAADLSRRLLIFSRQGETSEPRAVDPGAALRRLEKSLRRLLPLNIEIALESTATRPAHVDPSQLDQAILNLCLNARDAMPKGGRLELSARDAEPEGDMPVVVVEVRDTGTGMDAETLARATEPFFSTKAEGKGTGLGLAMVKKMVDQHRGSLAVESKPGEGSAFRLVLPACAAVPLDPVQAVVASGEGGRILLLDDDAALRRVLVRTLEDAGHSVVAVGHAAEAEALLTGGQQFHLLFTDGGQPTAGSPSVVESFLDRSPHGEVLVYSGLHRESLLERGVGPGNRVTVVQKPLPSSQLLALVGERIALAKRG